MSIKTKQKLKLGAIVATQQVVICVDITEIQDALNRHVSGDWGDVCKEDKQMNDEALTLGNRVVSVYKSSEDVKYYIITEHDRSVTTVLLPSEY
jgi:hypothetical protein